MSPGPLIGLSLSLCIADVVNGRVSLDQVDGIIAGTCARTEAEWDLLIDEYRRLYWEKDPDRAERIVRTMLGLDKIDQPRVRGEAPPRYVGLDARGHWRAA